MLALSGLYRVDWFYLGMWKTGLCQLALTLLAQLIPEVALISVAWYLIDMVCLCWLMNTATVRNAVQDMQAKDQKDMTNKQAVQDSRQMRDMQRQRQRQMHNATAPQQQPMQLNPQGIMTQQQMAMGGGVHSYSSMVPIQTQGVTGPVMSAQAMQMQMQMPGAPMPQQTVPMGMYK
ncbi:hypothetical protein KIPB_004863 [Kipferlia bialata]|uniref:Uncharacterized protein n=1 Tax=Kipferlia bialata TaxID=797122 RepID=A0A9K3CV54_9EUKA|nr:hypothetical protein KIPB_004863 [Kipferlia bialata]|eukprot:g4863.t1